MFPGCHTYKTYKITRKHELWMSLLISSSVQFFIKSVILLTHLNFTLPPLWNYSRSSNSIQL